MLEFRKNVPVYVSEMELSSWEAKHDGTGTRGRGCPGSRRPRHAAEAGRGHLECSRPEKLRRRHTTAVILESSGCDCPGNLSLGGGREAPFFRAQTGSCYRRGPGFHWRPSRSHDPAGVFRPPSLAEGGIGELCPLPTGYSRLATRFLSNHLSPVGKCTPSRRRNSKRRSTKHSKVFRMRS